MVVDIVATYERATFAEMRAGRDWYPVAGRVVDGIVRAIPGADRERVTFTLAALSPRNPWLWNVADAFAYTLAGVDGDSSAPPPAATTFGVNKARAWQIATASGPNGNPWSTAAPKVRAFVRAILGDSSAVVVDVWAIRVATAGRINAVREHEYGPVVDAYRQAADIVGEEPRDLQAITWLVAQREGVGSHRRGRHDATYKAGTPVTVRTIIATATIDGRKASA